MARIIVSYRRSDTAAIAGRIFDRLAAHYGEENVFMDIDKIPFGTDFREHIKQVLLAGDVLLAVIGPNWLGRGADGKPRIRDAADPVRVEVETALRQKIAVIPVLVDGAVMPAAADLPESLADFAFINAAPVDVGRDFRSHMDRLIRSMDAMFKNETRKRETELETGYPSGLARPPGVSPRIRAAVIAAAVLLLVASGVALLATDLFRGAPEQKSATPSSAAPKSTTKVAAGPTAEDIETIQSQRSTPPIEFGTSIANPPVANRLAPAAPANPTYRVLANVSDGIQNLRSGPALKYPLVISIPAGAGGITVGDCRPAEDNTKPWCAASWRKYSGWISSCCIVDEKTGAPPRLTAARK